MLKVTCPDDIDLKFMDENVVYTVEDGVLTVKDSKTKETLIRLEEGKWSTIITDETFITT